MGALSILCQRLHPHRARTQPGVPPPRQGGGASLQDGVVYRGQLYLQEQLRGGQGGCGLLPICSGIGGECKHGRGNGTGTSLPPGCRGSRRAPGGFGILEGVGIPLGFGILSGSGILEGFGIPGGFGTPDGFGIPEGFGILAGFGTPVGFGGPPRTGCAPPVDSSSSEGSDPAPAMLCGAGEGSRASLPVHTSREGFSPPGFLFLLLLSAAAVPRVGQDLPRSCSPGGAPCVQGRQQDPSMGYGVSFPRASGEFCPAGRLPEEETFHKCPPPDWICASGSGTDRGCWGLNRSRFRRRRGDKVSHEDGEGLLGPGKEQIKRPGDEHVGTSGRCQREPETAGPEACEGWAKAPSRSTPGTPMGSLRPLLIANLWLWVPSSGAACTVPGNPFRSHMG